LFSISSTQPTTHEAVTYISTQNQKHQRTRKSQKQHVTPFSIFYFHFFKKINKTKTKNHRAVLSYDHFYDGDRISPITLPTFSSGDSDPPESEENPL
jgi:hypothetical protein